MKQFMIRGFLLTSLLMAARSYTSSEITPTEKCSYCTEMATENAGKFNPQQCTCTDGCPCFKDRCPCIMRHCCSRKGKIQRPAHPFLPRNNEAPQARVQQ